MTVHYADAWVVNQRRELLMVYNLKLSLWLPPGGKMEYGETPYEAAIRELYEETSISSHLLTPVNVIPGAPVTIRKNQLPAYTEVIHGKTAVVHNFAFALTHDVEITTSDELGGFEWQHIGTCSALKPHSVSWTIDYLDSILRREKRWW